MTRQPTIAIIAAMQPELDVLQQRLANLQTSYTGAVTFHQGTLAGHTVVLALSGIGKVNAAMTTALLLAQFHPNLVINTGSAGGVGEGLHTGDVVIGAQTAHHDVDVTAFGYQHGQVPQLPVRFDADARLMAAAEQAATAFTGAAVRRGLIVSGDQFIDSATKISTIKQHFADVEAVEMEAAAIAQVCHQQTVPFVVIRAISDAGDDNASVSFDTFLQTASAHSAQMVCDLVRAL